MSPTTMPLARSTLIALLALGLAGCAAMNVGSYANRTPTPQQYRTYTWGPSDAMSTGDPRLDNNRFFADRVRSQVEEQLAKRGYEVAASGGADLIVHYHASVTQAIDVRDLDRGSASCEDDDCRPQVYDKGTLFVDLLDARTKALVWRGWAQGSIDGVIDDQAWMEKRIDEAVMRILERLPRTL